MIDAIDARGPRWGQHRDAQLQMTDILVEADADSGARRRLRPRSGLGDPTGTLLFDAQPGPSLPRPRIHPPPSFASDGRGQRARTRPDSPGGHTPRRGTMQLCRGRTGPRSLCSIRADRRATAIFVASSCTQRSRRNAVSSRTLYTASGRVLVTSTRPTLPACARRNCTAEPLGSYRRNPGMSSGQDVTPGLWSYDQVRCLDHSHPAGPTHGFVWVDTAVASSSSLLAERTRQPWRSIPRWFP